MRYFKYNYYIETNEQKASITTKPLYKPNFDYMHKHIMGWLIQSEIILYLNMKECECTENVKTEKYVCRIFMALINIHVYSRPNGFHDYRISKYT